MFRFLRIFSFCFLLAFGFTSIATPASADEAKKAMQDETSVSVSMLDNLTSGTYKLDPTHASIVWKVNHLGLSNYSARFTKFDSEVKLDKENIENSEITATIDASSVRTDYPYPEKEDFDKKLSEKPEWFNSSNFPKIEFKSKKIVLNEDRASGTLEGELEMLGVKKDVTFDVKLIGALKEHPFMKKPAFGIEAKATIKRSDWGFVAVLPNVGDEVMIEVNAEYIME